MHRRPAFGLGWCWIRQNARAHVPHRAHPGGFERGAVGDLGHHVHQQGGRRDARALAGPGRPAQPRHVGVHLPQHVRAHAARRCRAPGILEELHHLRHRRPEAPIQGNHGRAGHRPEAFPHKRPDEPHFHGEKRAEGARQLRQGGQRPGGQGGRARVREAARAPEAGQRLRLRRLTRICC